MKNIIAIFKECIAKVSGECSKPEEVEIHTWFNEGKFQVRVSYRVIEKMNEEVTWYNESGEGLIGNTIKSKLKEIVLEWSNVIGHASVSNE